MDERLALETLIQREPGVVDYSVERDWRGAVVQLKATVVDDAAKARLRELVTRVVGRHFAEERLQLNTDGDCKARIRLVDVTTSVNGDSTKVSVSLARNGSVISESAVGPKRGAGAVRLAAQAAISAIHRMEPTRSFQLCKTELLDMDTGCVVLTELLSRASSHSFIRAYGTAPADSATRDVAGARSVLDAVNRILGFYST